MKCQILTALIHQREDDELALQQGIQDAEEEEKDEIFSFQEHNSMNQVEGETTTSATGPGDGDLATGKSSHSLSTSEEREKLRHMIQRGGITPLEAVTTSRRQRMTVMDHKRASGGKIIMPPPRYSTEKQRKRSRKKRLKSTTLIDSGAAADIPPSSPLSIQRWGQIHQHQEQQAAAFLLPQLKSKQQKKSLPSLIANTAITRIISSEVQQQQQQQPSLAIACTVCALINPPTALNCEACDSILCRYENYSDEDGGRHCSKCTVINPPGAYRCEVCNSRLPRGKMLRSSQALQAPNGDEDGCSLLSKGDDGGLQFSGEEEFQDLQQSRDEEESTSKGLSSPFGVGDDNDYRPVITHRPQDNIDALANHSDDLSHDGDVGSTSTTSCTTSSVPTILNGKRNRKTLESHNTSCYRSGRSISSSRGKRRSGRRTNGGDVFGKTGLSDDFYYADFEERLKYAFIRMKEEEEEEREDVTHVLLDTERPKDGEQESISSTGGGDDKDDGDVMIIQNSSSFGEMKVIMEGDIPICKYIAKKLFLHQRTAIRWLGQLRESGVGGIIADEMGLGKTAQVAVYLAGLDHLERLNRGVLIVCPATVLCHWQSELHRWAPTLRVILLHISGANFTEVGTSASRRARYTSKVLKLSGHLVCLTSYEGLRMLSEPLLSHRWDACILDEAQRIRNPDAQVTLLAKRLKTPHRIALTGTPIQNSLQELWSLFDFVYPGRLGTLPAFEDEFIKPVRQGSYAGAGRSAIRLAYRSATALRSLISPYLLRRMKMDIIEDLNLPQKTEQILFCRLTSEQRHIYKEYLQLDDVTRILQYGAKDERGRCFRAISILRKLCNHPQLLREVGGKVVNTYEGGGREGGGSSDEGLSSGDELGEDEIVRNSYDPERSGKMQVLMKLMPQWKENGHKALIFCQTRSMLSIIQLWLYKMNWDYVRLDGNTPIGSRQGIINRFNSDPMIFVLIATTQTGGVGVNLVGADRVILFDPDWNPCTDAQAQERAWRLGQTVPVTVYRLISSGTIEEKIYQRQVFKNSQASAVLSKKSRYRTNKLRFSYNELQDLFSLGSGDGPGYADEKMEDELTREDDDNVVIKAANNNNESEKGDQQQTTEKEEAGILRALFDSTPLSVAFAHDPEGEELSSTNNAEDAALQAEVNEAVRQLRNSYNGHQNDRFTPTWTGQSGGGGSSYPNPSVLATESTGPPRKFGNVQTAASYRALLPMSGGGRVESGSATLLAQIGNRHNQMVHVGSGYSELGNNKGSDAAMREEEELGGGYSSTTSNVQLAKRLDTFFEGGRRHKTCALLEQFSDVPDTQAAHFRRVLRAVAVCKGGMWSRRDY